MNKLVDRTRTCPPTKVPKWWDFLMVIFWGTVYTLIGYGIWTMITT